METALVLQGGGALGASEVGVVRRLFLEPWFPPDIVAGVSIGAINAALLAGGRGDPVETMQKAWSRFAVNVPPWLGNVAGNWGNPNFYRLRGDVAAALFWTHLYDVGPLRDLLNALIDFDKLNSGTGPTLVLTAVDVQAGKIVPFCNRDRQITVDHILASGALPPSFPMVCIDGTSYWDGGVFSNTPLAEAIAHFVTDQQKLLVVVNLFRALGRIPTDWQEVGSRFLQIIFSNKLSADVQNAEKYNDFVNTMDRIEELCPNIDQLLKDDPGWQRLRQYDHIHTMLIEPTDTAGALMEGGHNFARESLEARIQLGFRDADWRLGHDDGYQQMRLACTAKVARASQSISSPVSSTSTALSIEEG